ncbi:shikimate kinase [Poseidonocella sp. HB161398]|uniref:shikimate kinase n=1 Tax=Poseidonocella sp. HB161398 TaxID=2320855 RepID=UPI00210453AE|nr:shikimate kinase [Poseidonocella sp. HB161398]
MPCLNPSIEQDRTGRLTYRLNKTVVLVGMMGCGKTSVGRELSRQLGVPFMDSDEEIVRASSYEIPELFARFGEIYFREKETQVILRLLQDEPKILSTGGGAWMNHTNRLNINRDGLAVWLQADVPLLWSRVKGRTGRPLLQTENPYRTLAELCESRNPVYARAPVHVRARPEDSVADTTGQVISELAKLNDILEESGERTG